MSPNLSLSSRYLYFLGYFSIQLYLPVGPLGSKYLHLKFLECNFFKPKFSVHNTYLKSLKEEVSFQGKVKKTKPLCPDHYLKTIRGFLCYKY